MFNWLRDKHGANNALPEIDARTDLDTLWHEDLVLIFKHSPACPVSWAAHAHVQRFRSHHPEVPLFMVSVIKERPVSRKIADRTDVEHESPQVICLRRGVVSAVASHGEITESQLAAMAS